MKKRFCLILALIFLLCGLYVLGLSLLYGIPALTLHLIEDFQLILADLHIAVVQHLAHAGLAGFQHLGGDIGQQGFFLIEQVEGQLLVAERLALARLGVLILVPGLVLLIHAAFLLLLAAVEKRVQRVKMLAVMLGHGGG